MTALYDTSIVLFNLTLLPVVFASILFLLLAILHLLMDGERRRFPVQHTLPFVSVQIPSFNDPVAARCVRRCLDFDYPKERYEIIIVDDSTDLATQRLLRGFARERPGFVKYVHRANREGFKPGALNNAMRSTKGEIIVIFDADWQPKRDFLRKVVRPFADPNVAIVQTRQGFSNHRTNLITRFAAYTLMIYHTIVMPINDRFNCVFFCGTAGAIRRSAMEKVGGWNPHSITEDSELTLRLLRAGYATVYLPDETLSEVPDTYESYLKQQMRWCYGNVRVFFDNAGAILWRGGLTLRQRCMITYVTLGNLIAPIIVAMTLFGFVGWFLGEPSVFKLSDLTTLIARFLYTSGFLLIGLITLAKRRQLGEFKYLIAGGMTLGLVLAVANTFAVSKATMNRKLHWFCTPKVDNAKAL